MSESGKEKFTPGPWVVKNDEWCISVICKDAPSGLPFAECPICDISQEEDTGGLHDAALIAAAPDMYAVLTELEESVDYWSEYDVPIGIIDQIRAAISKARGES